MVGKGCCAKAADEPSAKVKAQALTQRDMEWRDMANTCFWPPPGHAFRIHGADCEAGADWANRLREEAPSDCDARFRGRRR
jgi:hypothetical protein